MSQRTPEFSPSRRRVLGQGLAAAAGAGLWAGSPASAQEETLSTCASTHLIDGTITPFGAVRVVLGKGSGKGDAKAVAVPVRITAPEGVAELDVSGRVPTIRFGRSPGATIVLTPKGVTLKKGAKEEPWRAETVSKLLSAINADRELQSAVVALRAAAHFAYPQYLALSGHKAPGKIGMFYAKSNRAIEKFGKPGTGQDCQTTTFVETVTHDVLREAAVWLTAGEQAERCLKSCEDQFGSPAAPFDDFKPVEYALCAAGCTIDLFEDLYVGTREFVETVTDEVVRQVVVCHGLSVPPGFFPNPFDLGSVAGLATQGGGGTGAVDIDAQDVRLALDVLNDLEKLAPVIACLLKGEWRITKLRDLRVNVNGVQEIPFGVTVCVDSACAAAMSPLTAGKAAFGLLVALVTKAAVVEDAVVAAGVAAADVASVTAACMLIIGLLAILLAHLLIVAGEIAILDAAGLIGNGICITHPSLPVALVAAINPVAGILALGNTPLVVTPR